MDQRIESTATPATEEKPSLAKRVLIIDDEESIRLLLQEYLEIVGLDVDTASSGAEGLERFHSGQYGLIICDVAMPGLDGFQVYEQVYETDPQQPFLFITGYTFEGARRELINRSLGLLRKPFHLNDLYDIIARLFPDLENR